MAKQANLNACTDAWQIDLTSRIIKLRVEISNGGSEEHCVHEQPLLLHSGWYKDLHTDDRDLFCVSMNCRQEFPVYTKWLYTHKIDTSTFDAKSFSIRLMGCFAIGGYMQDHNFQDAVIDEITKGAKEELVDRVFLFHVELAYYLTKGPSTLRRL
ncbi:hypothetical protein EJ08DRAFT_695475 [Tothia fuscella]|uniref:Uncharacterized protein n=1 Tax=Tothia fuscella TaxID=1048955 RepID=A0A9P4TZC8_9PEZI|nr:hypothetical protein EJ08DRAFT_695475 [Tothia fuscella]